MELDLRNEFRYLLDPNPMTGKNISKDRLAELGTLAGGLAHEIKNPLSTIALNLALLREDWEGGESAKEKRALKKIALLEREVARLETIVNDFLRYAKGKELRLESCDLNRVVQEVADFIEPEAKRAGVQIRTLFAPDLPKIALDRDAFRQALLNLLVNAREAMPQGGELLLRTAVSGDARTREATLEVTDTGVGMAPDVLAQCFDIYYSTKRGGTGLGLPTVRRIVEAHGGDISVQSDAGRGTRFLLRFPAQS